jgi:hypothetical protein
MVEPAKNRISLRSVILKYQAGMPDFGQSGKVYFPVQSILACPLIQLGEGDGRGERGGGWRQGGWRGGKISTSLH